MFAWRYTEGSQHPQRRFAERRIPIADIITKIQQVHGDSIVIVPESYRGLYRLAEFIDAQYGGLPGG